MQNDGWIRVGKWIIKRERDKKKMGRRVEMLAGNLKGFSRSSLLAKRLTRRRKKKKKKRRTRRRRRRGRRKKQEGRETRDVVTNVILARQTG